MMSPVPPQPYRDLKLSDPSIDSFEAGSTWEKKSPIENVYHASLAAVNASASEVHMFFIFWNLGHVLARKQSTSLIL